MRHVGVGRFVEVGNLDSVHIAGTLINRLKQPSGPWMTERGMEVRAVADTLRSSLDWSPLGASTGTGDQTGDVIAAGESLRGWVGRQQGPRETKSAVIWDARQTTNEWLNMLLLVVG